MGFSKRFLTVALVVALTLASVSVAFADDTLTTERKAEVLHELDLFLGVDLDVFTPDLEGATDRAAAMVMVARALNWVNSEDWDAEGVSGFEDVPEWAEPHVAYAVNMEITYGVGNNRLGTDMDVTERQMQTWFDRALGKGDTWVDNEDLDNTTALIRADLVDHTWDALMQVPVGGEETLIDTIIGDDEDMLLIALAGYLVPLKEIDIDPDEYEITVDDLEKAFYAPGDTLEFTVRGLEPLTRQLIHVRIHTGPPGFPFFDDETFVDPSVEEGIVGSDGSITISGELRGDLPEGAVVITVPGYGYTIDNTLSLVSDGMEVMIGTDESE